MSLLSTGNLTGLAPSTDYVLDAVHVDGWGNESAVMSSSPFSTDAAAPDDLPRFIGQRTFLGEQGESGVYTWSDVSLGAGDIFLGVGFASGSNARLLERVTLNGIVATQIVGEVSGNRAGVLIFKVTNTLAFGDIVLRFTDNDATPQPANVDEGVSVYVWGGVGGVSITGSNSAQVNNTTVPWSLSANVNTTGEGKVLGVAQSRSATGSLQFNDLDGVSLIVGSFVDVGDGDDIAAAFEEEVSSVETPRSVSIGSTTMSCNRIAVAVIAVEVA